MHRSKVVEENGVEVILSQKRWAPSKMKFVLELLTAVVWPQWEISNSAMLIILVVVWVYLEHCFDEASHLFIALIEIWHYTSVGAACYFVLLKVPAINDDYKEHCFCATEKGVREAKWNVIECTPLSWTKGKEVVLVIVIRLLLLGSKIEAFSG